MTKKDKDENLENNKSDRKIINWIQENDSDEAIKLGVVKKIIAVPEHVAEETKNFAYEKHRNKANKVNESQFDSNQDNQTET